MVITNGDQVVNGVNEQRSFVVAFVRKRCCWVWVVSGIWVTNGYTGALGSKGDVVNVTFPSLLFREHHVGPQW